MGNFESSLEEMLELNHKVVKLTSPLFTSSPIIQYAHVELNRDGTFFVVGTENNYIRKIHENDSNHYLTIMIEEYKKTGLHIIDLNNRVLVKYKNLIKAMSNNGIGHQSIFIEKESDSTVKFNIFYGDIEDNDVNHFYINNTNLLKYFSKYISNEIKPHLNKKKPLFVCEKVKMDVDGFIDQLSPSTINIPKFLSSLTPYDKLTPRQWEIVHWYLNGKSAEETAEILGISKRTVEDHFIKIKQKLDCRKKPQIINELLNFGISFPTVN